MLDEEEYAVIHKLFGQCIQADEAFRMEQNLPLGRITMTERFRPVTREYQRMTGAAGCHHNAIMHHRIALYGEACLYCGKPLRTPEASRCAACGHARS